MKTSTARTRPGMAKPAATVLVETARSPGGANLDSLQIIKGWLDAVRKTHEQIFHVAGSGNLRPDTQGKFPPVGNTVDAKIATYSNRIGSPTLKAYWKDPEFRSVERVSYDGRVTEIPTWRWTLYDAKLFGTQAPAAAPISIHHRANTFPVWFGPA